MASVNTCHIILLYVMVMSYVLKEDLPIWITRDRLIHSFWIFTQSWFTTIPQSTTTSCSLLPPGLLFWYNKSDHIIRLPAQIQKLRWLWFLDTIHNLRIILIYHLNLNAHHKWNDIASRITLDLPNHPKTTPVVGLMLNTSLCTRRKIFRLS